MVISGRGRVMSICFCCEHCEAVERDNDLVLCCMIGGEENPVPVQMHGTCRDFSESRFAEVLIDATSYQVSP